MDTPLSISQDVDAFERSTLAAEEVKIMFGEFVVTIFLQCVFALCKPAQKIGLWYSMKCKEGDILHTYDYDDEFLILESGNASRKGRRYARGEYCIEVCCHLPDIKCTTGGASYLSQDFIMFIHVSCQGLPGQ